jgi:tetratricopeptide (TPR) repeat protein
MSATDPRPGATPRLRRRMLLGLGVAAAVGVTGVFVASAIGQGPGAGGGASPPAPATAPMIVPMSQPTTAAAAPAPASVPAAVLAPAGEPARAAAAQAPTAFEVDDSALRYFLQQGDTRRAQAEMQRLHRLYPNWVPPANLFDPNAPMPSDVQPIWDLYGAGDFAAARKAVADRQAAEPGWNPPDDLVAALADAGERQRLLNAADIEQWETVLSIADASPSILTCDNIEVLWRVAEAFARTGSEQRSVDAEAYIMRNCPGAPAKVASLQKALQFLPIARIEELLAMAVDPPAADPAFDLVRLDVARRQVAAANADPAVVASPEALARVAAAAQAANGAEDALLLGFYAMGHDDPGGAIGWFQFALQHGGAGKAAEGYVLAMHALGRDVEAEPIAYEWRNAGREAMAAYITAITAALTSDDAALVEQPLLDRFVRTVVEQRSPLGAQAVGWYAYNAEQPDVAADWFTASLGWHPSEVAAFGLGLSYRAMDNAAGLQDVLRTWVPQFPRLPELWQQRPGGGVDARSALSGYAPRRSAAADQALEALVRGRAQPAGELSARPGGPTATAVNRPATPTGESTTTSSIGMLGVPANAGVGPRLTAGVGCGGAAAGTVDAGWCLLEQNRPFEAAVAFSQASGSDAAYGAALAYLRMGLTRDAALASASAPHQAARRHELDTSIVTQQAIDAYERGKYAEALETLDKRSALASEQNDLLMLRGWSYYELGDLESARRMFEAVDAVAPSSATQRALNTVNLRMSPTIFRDK